MIERLTNFDIIDIYSNIKRYNRLFLVEDRSTNEEYNLLIFSLNDGTGNVCPKKLSQVKERATIL